VGLARGNAQAQTRGEREGGKLSTARVTQESHSAARDMAYRAVMRRGGRQGGRVQSRGGGLQKGSEGSLGRRGGIQGTLGHQCLKRDCTARLSVPFRAQQVTPTVPYLCPSGRSKSPPLCGSPYWLFSVPAVSSPQVQAVVKGGAAVGAEIGHMRQESWDECCLCRAITTKKGSDW